MSEISIVSSFSHLHTLASISLNSVIFSVRGRRFQESECGYYTRIRCMRAILLLYHIRHSMDVADCREGDWGNIFGFLSHIYPPYSRSVAPGYLWSGYEGLALLKMHIRHNISNSTKFSLCLGTNRSADLERRSSASGAGKCRQGSPPPPTLLCRYGQSRHHGDMSTQHRDIDVCCVGGIGGGLGCPSPKECHETSTLVALES